MIVGEQLNTFGQALSMARVDNRITLRSLSSRIGCSMSFLNDVERGEREPLNRCMLQSACNILKLDYDTMAQKAIETITIKAKWKYFYHD